MAHDPVITDTIVYKKCTLVQTSILSALFVTGVTLIVLAPLTMSPLTARALGMFFAVLPSLGLALSINEYKKIPKVYAYYLGLSREFNSFRNHYYWFNDAGIWDNRRLIAPWKEVYDVGLIDVWEEFFKGGPVRHGSVRIILKDGRNFVVGDVEDPDEVLKFMRERFWVQGNVT